MKKLQLLLVAMLFAIAGTEFTETRGSQNRSTSRSKNKKDRKKDSIKKLRKMVEKNSAAIARLTNNQYGPHSGVVAPSMGRPDPRPAGRPTTGGLTPPESRPLMPSMSAAVMPSDELL